MALEGVERRLSAVVALDIVGYSRMMGHDEAGTLARLKAARADIIDPAVCDGGGRIIKSTGDGVLAEFPSAQGAIRAAVAIQQALAAANEGRVDHDRMDARIGINVGDVMFDEGDIFGDGVNIAARLEAQAPTGGICINGGLAGDLRKLGIAFEDRGEAALKNIAERVRLLVIHAGGAIGAPPVVAPSRQHLSRRAITVSGAALLLAAAILWTALLPRHEGLSTEEKRAAIERIVAEQGCTWLDVGAITPGNRGVNVTLTGAAIAPPALGQLITRAAEQKLHIDEVDVSGVNQLEPGHCKAVDLFRRYRYRGVSRMRIERAERDTSRDVTRYDVQIVTVRNRNLPKYLRFLFIYPNGRVGVVASSLKELAEGSGQQKLDPNGPIRAEFWIIHSGAGNLTLMGSDRPIDDSIVIRGARSDDPAVIGTFERAAAAGNWTFELETWWSRMGGPYDEKTMG